MRHRYLDWGYFFFMYEGNKLSGQCKRKVQATQLMIVSGGLAIYRSPHVCYNIEWFVELLSLSWYYTYSHLQIGTEFRPCDWTVVA